MLGNSFMLSSNAGRFVVDMPSPGAVQTYQQAQGTAQQLVAWQTGDGEPQELELLVYPLVRSEGGQFADNLNWQDSTMLILTRSANAHRGRAGGLSYDTFLGMPANGLRMRFAAVSAVLKVANISASALQMVVQAGIYPVSGSNRDEEACVETRANVVPIPKGARAFRCVPGISETTARVGFTDTSFTNQNVPFVDFAVASVTAWTPIPRGAWGVVINGSNWAAGNGMYFFSSIFFQ